MNILVLPVTATLLAILYGIWWPSRNPSILRSVLKTTPVFLLAIFSYLSGNPWLLIIAFVFSAVGDAFLSREGEIQFLLGLGSFLLAHIAFAGLFFSYSPKTYSIGFADAMVLIGILTVMLAVLANLWPHLGKMKLPVLCYAAAIGTMAYSAWLSELGLFLVFGVSLFVFSDIVLAHGLFYWRSRRSKLRANYVVWVIYFLAQLLILIAFNLQLLQTIGF